MVPTSAAVDLQPRAAEAAALLKALAHPDRLLLLCQLVRLELEVAELGERSGMSQPSLSQQPAVLALLQTLCTLFCAPNSAGPAQGRRPPAATLLPLSKDIT